MAEETTRIVTGRRGKIFQKDIKKHVARLLHQHCRVKQGELEVKRRSGSKVILDTSRTSCANFGFYFLDRISCPSGKATVLGAALAQDKRGGAVMTLWVQIDEQKGVSYWDNGVDYESLINDVRWEKISDKTIPTSVIANLCSFVEKVDFNPLISWDYTVVDAEEMDIKGREELIRKFFRCQKCGGKKLKQPHRCNYLEDHESSHPSYSFKQTSSTEPKEPCPVCNKLFPVSALERHAAECYGDPSASVDEDLITLNFESVKINKFDDNDMNINCALDTPKIPTLKNMCMQYLLDALEKDMIQTDGIINVYECAFDAPFPLIKNACVEKLVGYFNYVNRLQAFKRLQSQQREHLYIEYIRRQTHLKRKTLLEILEYALAEDMHLLRDMVGKQLVTVKTVVSVFKSVVSEPDFERTRDYCIRFISESLLTEITESDDFKNLPKYLQDQLLDAQNERYQINLQEKLKQKEEDDFNYWCYDSDPGQDEEGEDDDADEDIDEESTQEDGVEDDMDD